MSAINDTTTMRRFSPPTTPGQQHHAATAKEREEENDDEKNLRGLSEFERMRERRIAKNMQRMREMGLEKIAAPFRRPIVNESASSSTQTPRKVRPKTKRFVFCPVVARASNAFSILPSSSLFIPLVTTIVARFCGRKTPTETTSHRQNSLDRKGKLF